jgi:hypothetical protein
VKSRQGLFITFEIYTISQEKAIRGAQAMGGISLGYTPEY